jgi:hypothetical protein
MSSRFILRQLQAQTLYSQYDAQFICISIHPQSKFIPENYHLFALPVYLTTMNFSKGQRHAQGV